MLIANKYVRNKPKIEKKKEKLIKYIFYYLITYLFFTTLWNLFEKMAHLIIKEIEQVITYRFWLNWLVKFLSQIKYLIHSRTPFQLTMSLKI